MKGKKFIFNNLNENEKKNILLSYQFEMSIVHKSPLRFVQCDTYASGNFHPSICVQKQEIHSTYMHEMPRPNTELKYNSIQLRKFSKMASNRCLE